MMIRYILDSARNSSAPLIQGENHTSVQQEAASEGRKGEFCYLRCVRSLFKTHQFPLERELTCIFKPQSIKITWKNDELIWIEQWPLMKEKLQAAKELIDTQLELKHIEESCSPWNSPIFAIKKKSNKWCLLTDLRKVNASMKPMGALQPGIPSPTTIPQNWYIIIIDLQDCFFLNTPLHPFSNHIGLHKRYQWTVLPQGMMNSPTTCQYYVAKALESVRKQFPDFLVIHYMDNILFSAPSVLETQHMFDIAQQRLKNSGLIIAPEKIQTSTLYHYLGFVINRQHITPQLTQIRTDKLSTLHDLQKLLGDINWIRPFLHQRLGSPCLYVCLPLSLSLFLWLILWSIETRGAHSPAWASKTPSRGRPVPL